MKLTPELLKEIGFVKEDYNCIWTLEIYDVKFELLEQNSGRLVLQYASPKGFYNYFLKSYDATEPHQWDDKGKLIRGHDPRTMKELLFLIYAISSKLSEYNKILAIHDVLSI